MIAIIVALVVLCALISCGVAGVALFKADSTDKESITQAEQHLAAAMTAVGAVTTSLESLDTSKPSASKINKAVTEADTGLKTARDEIASARATAEQWKDSQGKTDYLAALTAATDSISGLQDMVAYVDTAGGMLTKVTSASKDSAAANDLLNAAIRAGNRGSYSTMRSKAQAAQTRYVKAALLFREADKLDKSADLDKAARYCDLRKKQADVVVRMASEGSAHRYSAYNSDIKKMNAYGRSADKVGAAVIAKDNSWAEKRLAALQKAVDEASTKADTLRSQALQELGYTK
jgi:hypothetical protein